MEPGNFDIWMHRHATLFCLNSQNDLGTLAAFEEVFSVCGYTISELDEATTWLAANQPPKFMNEHLGRIHQRIRDRRVDRVKQEQHRSQFENFAHGLCGNQGMIVVPHLKSIVDGQWLYPWYTCAVLCNCSRAARIREQWQGSKVMMVPMSLETYEMRNPNWVEQMEQKRRQGRAEAEVRNRDGRRGLEFRCLNGKGET